MTVPRNMPMLRTVPRSCRLRPATLFGLAMTFGLCFDVSAAPTATCKDTQIDLGVVASTARPTAEFRIANQGDEPLRITKARTSCPSCMEFQFAKEPIAPGGSASLKATLVRLPPHGRVRKILYVHTTDPVKPVLQLAVMATVRGVYVLSPTPTFSLGQAALDAPKGWDYELASATGEEFSVREMRVPEFLAGKVVLGNTGARQAIHLETIPAKLPLGLVSETVRIRTDSPQMPLVEIPLTLAVAGPVVAFPPRLVVGIPVLGAGTKGAEEARAFPPSSCRVVLKSREGPCPPIIGMQTRSPLLQAKVLPGKDAADQRQIAVSLGGQVEPGALADLVVRLGGGDGREVRIPVLAVRSRRADSRPADAALTRVAPKPSPIPVGTLAAQLAERLDCTPKEVLSGGFRDERTQLAVWLAERVCRSESADRAALREAFGGMSVIQYARARDEVTVRMARDDAFRKSCEQTLASLRGRSSGVPRPTDEE